MQTLRSTTWMLLAVFALAAPPAVWGAQPPVAPGPGEPDWPDLLEKQWGLHMDRDLRNPVVEGVQPAALFVKADHEKPVTYVPILALGLESTTRGGWYPAGPKAGDVPDDPRQARRELWSYAFKQPESQMQSGEFTPPPLASGEVTFDPGAQSFGLWVSNDDFDDGGVYTQPAAVAKANERLRSQPYKAMIYPYRDGKTGEQVFTSYLIGWEYSTNDDFQDVVTRVDNVRLVPADPPLKGILGPGAQVRKLADGFQFVEGPAWDPNGDALYFSDIPRAHIIRYAQGEAVVIDDDSGESNGLMFDARGQLVRCEHKRRRVSLGAPGETGTTIISHYQDKRLNSPNDLWIDTEGGIYFTDPRYGPRDDLEQDKEAVYYVTADGQITRIIDDLVRPNGIALSTDGKTLYVIDNGAHSLHRYSIESPGRIGQGERIAWITHPDGMAVDVEGRLFIACQGGIWVLDADGKWIGMIETPEWPANCAFGGREWRTLFITARTGLYSIDTQTRGWHVHLDGPPPAKP